MARKVTAATGANEPDFDLKQKVVSHKRQVAMVTLKPGVAVPPHSHEHGYLVHALTKGRVTKTTFRRGKPVREEHIELKPGEPYYVPATRRGETISSKNIGRRPVTFGKIEDPHEPETWQFPPRTRKPRKKGPPKKAGPKKAAAKKAGAKKAAAKKQ